MVIRSILTNVFPLNYKLYKIVYYSTSNICLYSKSEITRAIMKYFTLFLICFTTMMQSRDISSASRSSCPLISIPYGRYTVRSSGRVVRFRCLKGYQLYGSKQSVCVGGTWSTPIPVCIKPDCRTLGTPRKGNWLYTYRGAVATLTCEKDFTVNGNGTIYCSSKQWSGPLPICQGNDSDVQTSCNFESQDLCGWTQDHTHNFDWIRNNLSTPSGHLGTGPSFDHTLGKGLKGNYMYTESSSPQIENDTARLLSPIYNPSLSVNSCFIFWYHMYGIHTGTLNVNLKLRNTAVNNTQTVFSKSGDQGNRWYVAVVQLPEVDKSFQIVMEGIRGRGHVGDMAIDDVQLTSGDGCQNITMETLITVTPQAMVTSFPSSAEFVTVALRTARPFPTYLPPPSPPTLPPIPPALTIMTSPAPPYHYTRYTNSLSTAPAIVSTNNPDHEHVKKQTTEIVRTSSSVLTNETSSTNKEKHISSKMTTEMRSIVDTTIEEGIVTTIVDVKPWTVAPPSTVTGAIITKYEPFSPSIEVVNTTISIIKTTLTTAETPQKITQTTASSPTKSPQKITTIAIPTKPPRKITKNTTTSTKTPQKIITNAPSTRPVQKSTTTSPSTKSPKKISQMPTLSSPQPHDAPISRKPSTATSSKRRSRTTALPFAVTKESKYPAPAIASKSIAAITLGVAAVAIIAAVTIFILARRRMTLRRRNELAEDSDVRFLTSDEVLDFNLARPRDDDL